MLLNENSNKITQFETSIFNVNLMEHQKSMIYAMTKLEEDGYIDISDDIYFTTNKPINLRIETQVGILGDRVGSGKSYMILGTIIKNNNLKLLDKNNILSGNSLYCIRNHNKYNTLYTNLFILPSKLIIQWEEYISKTNLSYVIYSKEEEINIDNLPNIIILDNELIKNFTEKYGFYKFSRIIIDEIDTIKFPRSYELDANFIWLITGTPKHLLYSKNSFVNTIFNKENKNWLISYLTLSNENEYIEQSIKLPPITKFIYKCKTPIELNILDNLIPKNIVNLINAGNTEEAIKKLNCDVSTTDNLIQVVTKNYTDTINNYEIELKAEKEKKFRGEKLVEQEKKIQVIKNIIKRLKNRLESIKEKIENMKEELCPICMGEITNPVILKCCKNYYCIDCLTVSITNNENYKCPNCRENIGMKDFLLVNDEKPSKSILKINKLDKLKEIITNNKGKYLVFANYDKTIKKIEEELNNLKLDYRTLKKNGDENINLFKTTEMNILLLDANYYGAGINLQEATDIIIYHRFTKEIEEQIIGRGQRLGRKESLRVHYLVHMNEEDNVWNNFLAREDVKNLEE